MTDEAEEVTRNLKSTKLACLAGALFLAWLSGCSSSNEAYVTGHVSYDGAPLCSEPGVRATVAFHPVSAGAMATGILTEEGEYELSSGSEEGLVPGSYLVTVSAARKIPAEREGDAPSRQRITPARYASPKESPFRVEVQAGSNQFDFDLSSSEE